LVQLEISEERKMNMGEKYT